MRWKLSLALVLSVTGVPAGAQDLRAPRLHVLENGLRVLTVEDHATPIVAATWSAHVGDSAEPLDFAGNSHYLEHLLLFRGTEAHPKNEIGEWVAGRGGYFNGHTWYDYTTFEIMGAAEDLDEILARHEQMMFHAAFSGQDFETEKEAVIEERRTSMDRPYGYLWNTIPYRIYPEETFYSRSTIGTEEAVRAATVERVREYYEDYYVPNNMTLAIVGDFDTDEALELVEERFASYPRRDVPAPRYAPVELRPGMTVEAEEREVSKAYFLMAVEGPTASSPEYFPFFLLSAYLDWGNTSLLRSELVSERKLLDAVSVTAMARRYPKGWQVVTGEAAPSKLADGIDGIWELIADVRARGVPEEEMELARGRALAWHRTRLDDLFTVATELVESDAHGDYRLFSGFEERLAGVTASDLHAVAVKYLTPDRFHLLAIFPPGEIPQGFEERVRGDASARAATGGGALARTLESGATLLHEIRPGSAMESFTVAVRAGDRDGSPGVASCVAEMMSRETERHGKRELSAWLDRSGLQLSAWTSSDAAFFHLVAPAGSTAEAGSLLVEVLTEPAFSAGEWDAVQAETSSSLAASLDSPATVAYDALRSLVYGESAYGRSIQATRDAIAELESGDLRSFWETHYRASDIAVAYSGGASDAQVSAALAGLSRLHGSRPEDAAIDVVPIDGERRVARPMEGKTQAHLYVAWPAPPIRSDEWILWELAERAIGGDLAGRLWKLRQDEGLAYSVWLSGSERRDRPITHVYMATAAAQREEAIAAIHREVRRAIEGLTEEELARVKVSYLADLNRRDRTVGRRSHRMAEWWSQGLSADRRERLTRVIDAATLDAVNAVVRDVLHESRYYFAEAGAVPD